ncbi:MAG: family 78 glycoside hydrolase catalytic domain [Lentisphaeria bacterium]
MTIFDFGQNITGWVKIRYRSHPGRLFTIRFAEMLNSDGTLYTLNYRSAHSTDYLITSGPLEEVKTWEPRFTFHGFRYVQVDGFQFANAPNFIEATAVVIHSDLPNTGKFECGDDKVNQLYSNITWGQRDNFLEIPTDCPQRDERLGWTGDAQVFCATAACNQNVSAFFRKWLRDQREAQFPDGSGAIIVPNLFPEWKGEAGWADALVIVPWIMYQRYADISFLQEGYDSMRAWIIYRRDTATNLIPTKNSLGDWLALAKTETPKNLIGTAYFAFTTELMARTAALLGKKQDADYFHQLCAEIKLAFQREFLDESGLLTARTQTACVLALHFDLLPESSRAKNAELLRDLIAQNGMKLDTGFLGTAYLTLVLAENNLHETAYSLLLQEEYPSWLFSVNQGATTIWERWNSYTREGGFGDVLMNSFNHYAYGAVGEWMFKYVAGLDYETPGGKILLFRLVPDKRLGFAKASLQTPYGLATCGWQFLADGNLCWNIQIPPNTSAKIEIPEFFSRESIPATVQSGQYQFVIRSKNEK